jgi:nitroreductase
MDIKQAIKERHSVRKYKEDPIPEELVNRLGELIRECNAESGLHIQLILEDPGCFDTLLAHYGWFRGVRNYIAIVGEESLPDMEELGGYYGEKVVIEAQRMGLNTCWVAGTYSKSKCRAQISPGEKLVCVITIGYGQTQGKRHKSKPISKVCGIAEKNMPDWFREGVDAALKAPTAINQQKFYITLEQGEPVIKAKRGPLTKIDLGIVRYHFEAASGHSCR